MNNDSTAALPDQTGSSATKLITATATHDNLIP